MDNKLVKDDQLNYLINLFKSKYIENISITDDSISITKNGIVSEFKLSINHEHTAEEIGADPAGSAKQALDDAKLYTDNQVSTLINGAPETRDTLYELNIAINDNKELVDILNDAIGSKVGNTEFNNHLIDYNNPHNITKDKIGLDKVENKSSNDIISEITKENITNALGYTPPTENTTYNVVTDSTSGLMDSTYKVKLDNIEPNANKTIIDDSLSDSSTNPVQNKVITNEINTINGKINNFPTSLPANGGDADTVDGYHASSFVNTSDVVTTATANKLLKLNSSKKLPASITGSAGSVAWSGVTGKPTTLSGYGITDAVASTDVVTTATANKLLKLNSSKKLPADITGNAATATSVAWSGVTGKPTTLSGYGITDAVASTDVVTTATANKLLKLDSNSKLPASITGDADTLDGKHASDFATSSALTTVSNRVGTTAVSTQISTAIDNLYDYSTTDLTAGSSSLTTGKLYFVYE